MTDPLIDITEQECDDCKFARPGKLDGYTVLECHRNPPTVNEGWPIVGPTDWCGEWEMYQ